VVVDVDVVGLDYLRVVVADTSTAWDYMSNSVVAHIDFDVAVVEDRNYYVRDNHNCTYGCHCCSFVVVAEEGVEDSIEFEVVADTHRHYNR
jgi:hypothetical protein